MKTPLVEFRDYSFKYRTQTEPTLKTINLTLYKGEKVLIVGPSGSGKSTLASCLNGLVPHSYAGEQSGSLLIHGKTNEKLSVFDLSSFVGTVLQDPDGQFVGLTVAEDIAFALENDCVAPAVMKEKVAESAALVGVGHLLERSPQALSGGQKQRVALAGVLTSPLDLLLFDEPLANLDPATGNYAMELIDDIHRKTQATLVIIEHRLEDVLRRQVDRIIVVHDGCIAADSTPDELLATSVLTEIGIREPLYLTALKYAGCEPTRQDHLASLHLIPLERHRENLLQWFFAQQARSKEKDRNVILEAEDISFSYRDQEEVLSMVSFHVQQGEMLSIVGKNGAGKSTLSKLICGFEKPTNGWIRYQGEDLAPESIKQRAEKIGMVMQNPNQMISKAMVFDEVALGLQARGIPAEETKRRVEETLRICGLYPYRNWPISALSFGQKKRVTIASILVLNPRILILDEPTAGQDFRHYTEIMEFLKRINQEHGVTILMITHDMHLMLEYADRTLVLSDGRLIADAAPAEVLTDQAIIEAASLKVTSLYELAVRSAIPDPIAFVDRFIAYDKEVRRQ
ncbi:ABC transporter ATP-binding protein [Gorillibacterium sp. CAU 1737]|uniref:ABC transporter ATP-binding protein n=1 Tax=Gorillibacterium sp. CAU 1737 TaxID=3140362 RepID=UPI003261B316